MPRSDATAVGEGRPDDGSPRAGGALEESRLGFERAASLRESLARFEDDLTGWREKLASRAPHGRRWRTCLASGRETVADAGGLYLRIRNEEHEALEALRQALAEMHGAGADVVRLLEESVRIRGAELRQIDETIQVTHRLLNLPPEATPDEVLFLLEDRARHLASCEARGRECDELERRARELLAATAPADAAGAAGAAAEAAPPIEGLERDLERITDLAEAARSELDRLRASLAAAERRAEEAKAEVARLAAESRDRESCLGDARRERDEALALVTSLARRLGTPGLVRPPPEDGRPDALDAAGTPPA